MTRPQVAAAETRDVDVRGLITVRLVGVNDADARAVERQLGLPSGSVADPSLAQEAALTVRYVERLPAVEGRLLKVGPPDLCWTETGAVVLRARGRGYRWASIPFDRIGASIELECERGIGRVPHLVSLLNLSLLARGVVPLHASAFVLDGVGSVAAGWSQSGKTEALLAAMGAGATMVSDEWTYLTPDGQGHGLATPIRLESWHLRAGLVRQRAAAAIGHRRLLSMRVADRFSGVAGPITQRLPPAGLVRRASRSLLRSDHVDVHPEALFGPGSLAPALRIERVYWLVPRAGDGEPNETVRVQRVSGTETAARMAVAHVHHRLEFLDAYWRFRYAFPERRSELVEDMEWRERELLESAFANVPIYRLEHPPRVSLGDLREAMAGAGG